MYYTIYQITNLQNKKVYVGKHQTTNLDDRYMGSGYLLLKAHKKYGIQNFSKEILFVFDNKEEMDKKENDLVNEDFVLSDTNYNICVGGRGGFDHVNRMRLNVSISEQRLRDPSIVAKAAKLGNERKKWLMENDPVYAKKLSETISNGLIQYFSENEGTFTGKSHTKETKQKMSGPREKAAGKNNSQFGTMWITDGVQNKKIQKNEEMPLEWYKGRTTKKSCQLMIRSL